MLRSIQLANFKPFRNTESVPLRRITLIYGPNSGGKSSLIQSLLLLRQTFRPDYYSSNSNPRILERAPDTTALIPRGSLIDLGSFRTILFKHDMRRSLQMSLGFDEELLPRGPVFLRQFNRRLVSGGSLLRSDLTFRGTRRNSPDGFSQDAEIREVGWSVSDSRKPSLDFRLKARTRKGQRFFRWGGEQDITAFATLIRDHELEKQSYDRDHPGATRAFGRTHIPSLRSISRLQGFLREGDWGGNPIPTWFNHPKYEEMDYDNNRSPLTAMDKASDEMMRGLAESFYRQLTEISYLGPLRAPASRQNPAVPRGAPSTGVRGEHAAALLYQNRDLLRETETWFKDMEIDYGLDVKPIGDAVAGESFVLQLTDGRTGTEVSPVDVGVGISQLLPIVIEGVAGSGSTLCVEQPELHLHPRLQANVMDFIIKTSSRKQWIVETHSEMLILRLKRRIREQKVNPDDVSILYVDPRSGNGSKVTELRLDADGEFKDEWPQGFFEEAYEELMS